MPLRWKFSVGAGGLRRAHEGAQEFPVHLGGDDIHVESLRRPRLRTHCREHGGIFYDLFGRLGGVSAGHLSLFAEPWIRVNFGCRDDAVPRCDVTKGKPRSSLRLNGAPEA